MRYHTLRIVSVATLVLGLLLTGTASAKVSCPSIARTLKYGSRGADVTILQTYLATNAALYPEAAITGYFGPATERAVQRFQASRNIVSSGTAASTGYGSVGARTRAALLTCETGSTPTTASSTPQVTAPQTAAPVSTAPVTPPPPSNPLVTYADGATTTVTLGAGATPSINSFYFAPRSVELTDMSTNIMWTSSNAYNCSVEKTVGGATTVVAENVGVNGSTNVVISDDPTYISLRCTGLGDNSTSSPSAIKREVVAHIAHPKPSCTVTTDKDSYAYTKDTIILKWTTVGADTITWSHSNTAVDPVALPYGNQYSSGSLFLSSVAGSSQIVTLNVSGYGGSATCFKSFTITSAL